MRGSLPLTIACAALLLAAAKVQADPRPFRRGWEASAQVGAGGFATQDTSAFTSGGSAFFPRSASPVPFFGPGFGVQAALGLRFHRFLGAGVQFHYQFLTCSLSATFTDCTGAAQSAFHVGPYARLYGRGLFGRYLEPWLGVGLSFGYFEALSRSTLSGFPDQRYTHAAWAVALPVHLGLDFLLPAGFAVGLTGGVTPWLPIQIENCVASGTGLSSGCSDQSAGANLGWFAGLELRVQQGF